MIDDSISVISSNCISGNDEPKEKAEIRQVNMESNDVREVVTDSISVISLDSIPSSDEPEENLESDDMDWTPKQICQSLGLSVGVIAACVLFTIPLTTVPRTNSIIYQSHWMEICLPSAIFFILSAAGDQLNLTVWAKERKLMSVKVFLKLYFSCLMLFIILYVLCYFVWSVNLGFNHPLPFLGVVQILAQAIFLLGLWFLLPSDLLAKNDFRRKIRIYMVYFLWTCT